MPRARRAAQGKRAAKPNVTPKTKRSRSKAAASAGDKNDVAESQSDGEDDEKGEDEDSELIDGEDTEGDCVDGEEAEEDSEEIATDDSPPQDPSLNPYETLSIATTATAEEIKRAYRIAALKHHPDKAPPDQKAAAHSKFQTIAFAYSILSSPARRARYDATGSTRDLDDDDEEAFNWRAFYRAQFAEVVSAAAIEAFKAEYRHSAQERADVLAAYTEHKGNLDLVFESVMLSDAVEDEERFRKWIDEAIEKGEIVAHRAYLKDGAAKRKKRVQRAKKEAEEAEELARELGLDKTGRSAGGGKKSDAGGEDALRALIRQRQKGRMEGLLESLERKYAPAPKEGKRKKGGRRKRASPDDDDNEEEDLTSGVTHPDGEPPEEAFQRVGERLGANRAKRQKQRA